MTKFFFDAMEDEPEAIAILERELGTLLTNKRPDPGRSAGNPDSGDPQRSGIAV
jgi:hypothetical protein